MNLVEKIASDLGSPYIATIIDFENVIYRNLGNNYEFEVSGIKSMRGKCILYVWRIAPKICVGVYENISVADLKDILGHYATQYRNLTDQIRVEREDPIE
ncbi:hypothetical protein [Lacrimispora sp. JR3]|uniref:hypothetical protein n=1 Tax=Lacrimispora sinapis TaxID=3111456 RepID=UPI0037491C5B